MSLFDVELAAKDLQGLSSADATKRNAQARLVAAILPVHLLPAGKTAETVAP